MEVSAELLAELGLLLLVLAVAGSAARRVSLSPVPLYLVAGLVLGEGGLVPGGAVTEFIDIAATLGLVLLLLVLGLQFTLSEFTASLGRHRSSALVDVVLNATPGVVVGWAMGLDTAGVMALGGATYISSSGIIARILGDLGRLGNRETPAVLSVLVLEDFAMAAYLPVLAVVATGGSWWQALVGVAVALTALGVAFTLSHRFGGHLGRVISHPDSELLMLRVLGLTLVVAALAEFVHVSAAVGAFLVGLTLSEAVAERTRAVLSPLRDLFAALFFMSIGVAVHLQDLVPVLPAVAVWPWSGSSPRS